MTRVWDMNAAQLYRRADDIAENAFLKLIGRIGMALVAPVFVVSISWLGTTIWQMNTNAALLTGKVDVLSERITDQLIATSQRVTDQDRRIQRLEDEVLQLQRPAAAPAK